MSRPPQKSFNLAPLVLPLNLFLVLVIGSTFSVPIVRFMGDLWGYEEMVNYSRVLEALLWFGGAWLVSRALVTLVLHPLVRRATGQPAPGILANCLSAVVFLVTIFMVVHFVYDRPVGGLLATSGIVTLVIGFAIRDMIADFFSGMAMNLERPCQIGDWVELEPGTVGQVVELNWRATRLRTLSDVIIVVPNSNLAGRQFINYSSPEPHYRDSLKLVLNYTSDPNRVENIMLAAILSTDGLSAAKKPSVVIREFTERGVVYDIRYYVENHGRRARARSAVAANILQHLHQAGIAIPYGQQEVVLTRRRRPRQEIRINQRRLLSRVDWLAPLNESELQCLASATIDREYSAGQNIVEEGEQGSSLFVLVEGIVEAHVSGPGSPARMGRIMPGMAFGEMSMLTGSPRGATITALTDVYCLEVRRDDLEPILKARPAIASQLGKLMAARQDLNRKADLAGNDGHDEEMTTRAARIARKISAFFGVAPG